MSTEGHNTWVGKVAIVTGISMACFAGDHFIRAKVEESKIIPRERYEEIAESYVPIATECVRMEDFGTRGVTQNTRDRQCIGNQISKENLDNINNYNNYHKLSEQTGRLFKNVFAGGLIGIGAIGVACGAGYREG
jgi:hypothetical protein